VIPGAVTGGATVDILASMGVAVLPFHSWAYTAPPHPAQPLLIGTVADMSVIDTVDIFALTAQQSNAWRQAQQYLH